MYRLIAFDLDGTFLNNDKSISSENLRAVEYAFSKGVLAIPATGRIPIGLPPQLQEAGWLRYGIFCNGAFVSDCRDGRALFREEIEPTRALEVFSYLDSYDVLYDIYCDGRGYIGRDMLARAPEYVTDPAIMKMVIQLRTPVDDLKAHISTLDCGIQKLQVYFPASGMGLRRELLRSFSDLFPGLVATTAMPFNLEINCERANKGTALESLCGYLGIPLSDTIAFGDNSNDVSMLRTAGLGIAVSSCSDEARQAAGYVTGSNEEHGVADAIYRFIG